MSAEPVLHGPDAGHSDGVHDSLHAHPGAVSHEERGAQVRRQRAQRSRAPCRTCNARTSMERMASTLGISVEMFRRRFWWSLLLTVPIVVTSHMVMDWFGYELDFPGIDVGRPGARHRACSSGAAGRSSTGGVREAKQPPAGDDAADRDGDHGRLRGVDGDVARRGSTSTSGGSSAALVTIMLLGHWQEMKALGQAQDALAALAALLPDEAERIDRRRIDRDGRRPASCEVGDVVLVRSGSRVPADGEIIDGAAELDESMITGESRPVAKRAGDRVVAGTVSTDSALRVAVTAVGDDTALAGIRRLVAEAQESELADPGARRPGRRAAVLRGDRGAAIVTAVVWTLLGDGDEAVVRVVTVLVISCPHALGLAIPLDDVAVQLRSPRATGSWSRTASRSRRAAPSTPSCSTRPAPSPRASTPSSASPAPTGSPRTRCCGSPAAVEADSEHPLARAIVDRRRAAAGSPPATGVPVAHRPRRRSHRRRRPLRRRRTGAAPRARSLARARRDRRARSTAGRPAAPRCSTSSRRRRDPRRASRSRTRSVPRPARPSPSSSSPGRRVVMITGDAHQVADAVASDLGVDEVFAEVLPEDKAAKVAELQARGLQGGDGRRRRQRRPRARPRRRRHRDRRRHRRRHRVRRADPRQLRPPGRRSAIIRLSEAAYRKIAAEPGVGRRLQRRRHPARRRRVRSGPASPCRPHVAAILMSVSTIVVALNAQLLRRLDLRPGRGSNEM